ncbi:amidohydrolase family protein [Paenibacillus alkalitolerans]|uniref:amidohydrolase family protein n=1 Tax=Paenibacillus alkalitolerans TaxID=2799335 RepID=UPI001F398A8E|nr:amidohydrolase family protein [Paenibacillus alkalitolerans]
MKMLLYNVRLPLTDEARLYTAVAEEGVWSSVEPQSGAVMVAGSIPLDEWKPDAYAQADEIVIDVRENMLLPGLVDAHMHLDKSFTLPRVGNESGTLEEAVRNYAAASPSFTKEEIKARITRAAMQAISFGTSAIRTHLDFNVKAGRDVALRTIEAALEVKEALAPYVTLQLFPMCPYNQLSSAEMEVAEEAIRMGVDGLGGAPHLSSTQEEDIDAIFRLAERYGRPIDLHTDESDDPNIRTVSHIAKRTMEYGFTGRVTVGHLCSLAAMPDEVAGHLIGRMAEAGLGAVTLPGANLYLQGRRDGFPVRRGVTRVKELLAAGIPLAAASDNIHDPFHPFGRGDLVLIGLVTAYAAHMGSPSDLRTLLRMITDIPAAVLGLTDYGVKAGNKADFVIFDGRSPEELFTELPERRWVYRGGRWLKIAASRAGWNDSALSFIWDSVTEAVSFGGSRRTLKV